MILDARDHVPQSLLRVRHGIEVVAVEALRHPSSKRGRRATRLHAPGQRLQLVEEREIDRVGAADRERDAMHHDGVALRDPVEEVHRPAARVDEVLRHDLEPVHRRPLRRDMPEMLRAQAYAEAEIRQAPSIRHDRCRCRHSNVCGHGSGSHPGLAARAIPFSRSAAHVRRIDRHAAAALALAGVLAGAAIVAALAAALALARVLARALVLGFRGAAALALAGVLAGAAAVAGLAATLALAGVMAFTDVVVCAAFLAGVGDLGDLGAGQQAARYRPASPCRNHDDS